MIEYPKIYAPYLRDTERGPNRNKLIEGAWARPEFEYLQYTPWNFTEKVNGTNVRVHWNGHKVSFGGRTDDAQLPVKLLSLLQELFPEELFEQVFGSQPVTLFGEGFGGNIQSAQKTYGAEYRFALFDVLIDGWWLTRPNVVDVSHKLEIEIVPLHATTTLIQAIDEVKAGLVSQYGEFPAEGLVGVPTIGLLDRAGKRIMVKVKHQDFPRS